MNKLTDHKGSKGSKEPFEPFEPVHIRNMSLLQGLPQMPENTGQKQNKTKFQKGQSGNPRGRPHGARNQASLMAEQLLRQDIEDICKSVITEAKAGNMQAAKLILDRLLPPRKDLPISIDLPKIQNSSDAVLAMASITTAIGLGQISPNEGESLSRTIDVYVRALEVYDYEKRLNMLEEKANQ